MFAKLIMFVLVSLALFVFSPFKAQATGTGNGGVEPSYQATGTGNGGVEPSYQATGTGNGGVEPSKWNI